MGGEEGIRGRVPKRERERDGEEEGERMRGDREESMDSKGHEGRR